MLSRRKKQQRNYKDNKIVGLFFSSKREGFYSINKNKIIFLYYVLYIFFSQNIQISFGIHQVLG